MSLLTPIVGRPTALLVTALSIAAGPSAAAQDEPVVRPKHPVVDEASHDDRFTTSRDGRWLDLPAEDETFTFVVFGDRTGGPDEGIAVLAQAVEETNLLEPDLVMTVGDLIQGYNTTEPWMTQMREYRDTMSRLLCPWFPVAGNHDVYWRGPDRPEEEHEARYEMHFGPLWYAFDHKDSRFIVLYSDEPNPETGERNFGKAECQRMSPEQFAWLESTLAGAKDKQHVFCFLHHPRWIGGRYGDDWERVHELLADAGNVRAVFAGHIHYMRYDGPRDGIEYVTLATVGGHQSGHVPSAGWLHQFHHVTVRPDGIALASLPVGTTMDVRDITADVSLGAADLAKQSHESHGRLVIGDGGAADGEIGWTITNPTTFPIEIELLPGSADLHWSFQPDHVHATLEPGEARRFDFGASRPATADATPWREPVITMSCDLIGGERRYPMLPKAMPMPLAPDFSAADAAGDGTTRALDFDGVDDAAIVAPDAYELPDGPFTLEAWFEGDRFDGRTGLATRTEGSEFGLFVSDGRPDFSVHLDGAYATVRGRKDQLEPGRRHHLAGVFDGAEIRLYLDGELIGSKKASGRRTRNDLPFIVGADVRRDGTPMSFFDGRVDAVRLSKVARDAAGSIDPAAPRVADADTVLLLDFDRRLGAWTWDASSSGAHPRLVGEPSITTLD